MHCKSNCNKNYHIYIQFSGFSSDCIGVIYIVSVYQSKREAVFILIFFFFTFLKGYTCEQISMHFLQNEADLGRRHFKKLIILYHQSSFYKQPLRHRGSNIGYSLYLQRVLICRYFTTGIFIIQRIALFLLCFLPKNIIISLIFLFLLHFVDRDYSRTMTG